MATPHDAKSLAALAEATFRETFAPFNTPGDIAEEARGLAAYAQVRWGKAPPCVMAHAPGEIQRLYVRRGAQGTGLAHLLMRACLDEIRPGLARGVGEEPAGDRALSQVRLRRSGRPRVPGRERSAA